jgi:hypothetical protein
MEMATPQFIVGAEGFDRYPAGALSPVYPWVQLNTNNTAAIVPTFSLFNSNALGVPPLATNSCGWVYVVPSTAAFQRNNTKAGGTGAFGFCGYIRLGSLTTQGTDTMLAMGCTNNSSPSFPILGQSYSTLYGQSLAFPSQVSGLGTKPYLYSVKPNTWVWVGIYFSFTPTGKLLATYCINGKAIWKDVTINWLTDLFAAGQTVNMLKVYNGTLGEWYMDDMVLHAASTADANWPNPTALTPEVLPQYHPKQITMAQATATAFNSGFFSMTTEPDWQAVTDLSGQNSIGAYQTTGGVGSTGGDSYEYYNWTPQAQTGIKALIYRGQSSNLLQVSPAQVVGGQETTMAVNNNGPQNVGNSVGMFVGISENDGTNHWTQASIEAATFGQFTHN